MKEAVEISVRPGPDDALGLDVTLRAPSHFPQTSGGVLEVRDDGDVCRAKILGGVDAVDLAVVRARKARRHLEDLSVREAEGARENGEQGRQLYSAFGSAAKGRPSSSAENFWIQTVIAPISASVRRMIAEVESDGTSRWI